jgi:hypothetical protein
VEVVFTAPAGAELTPNDTVLTASNGRATVNYTLATVSGPQTIEARAKPVVQSASLTTTFSLTAMPEGATGLIMAGGDEQVGDAGTALADSLTVKAVDRFGNGVPGVGVTWEASDGGVSPATVVTGADGRAATERTLGARPGAYQTTASAADLEGSPVAFTATGIGPPTLVLVTQPSATASAGVPFNRQPVLQLQDEAGAPLPRADVAVTVQIASGDGSLGGGTTVRSNAEGVVRFTNLSIGGTPGDRTLIFAASDFISAISRDVDVGPGPPLVSASTASVPPNGTAGVPTAITVALKDAFGTPVNGAAGSIAISIAGVNPTTGLAVSGQGNGSYSAPYTPIVSGTDQVDVRVSGTPVPGSPFLSNVIPGPADPATTQAGFNRAFFTIDVLVTTRDAHSNVVGRGGDLVQVQLDSSAPLTLTDLGDGRYWGSFFTFATTVAVILNGVPIAGSPFQP